MRRPAFGCRRLLDVLLTLEGDKTLSASVVSSDYALDFSFPLAAGMTPIISYWTAGGPVCDHCSV